MVNLPDHLQQLCRQCGLGKPLAAPEVVHGGFHHRMWGVTTSRGRFAVKQLAVDLDLHHADTIKHFELTETVASRFADLGIPAVAALNQQGRFLQIIDSAGYLVYPWIQARSLQREKIERKHVARIAKIFAAMHGAEVDVPGLSGEEFAVMDESSLEALVQFAHSRNSSRVRELEEQLPVFRQIIHNHTKAAASLSANTLVSHGDLDHKNVLWSAEQLFVIDWESARRLNPTHEIVLEALDWSGITLDFNEDLFDHMVSVYLGAGGKADLTELEAAFHCVLGDWLNWLMYNLGRSIDMDDEQQRRIGGEQVDHALATLLRLQRLTPRLLAKLN